MLFMSLDAIRRNLNITVAILQIQLKGKIWKTSVRECSTWDWEVWRSVRIMKNPASHSTGLQSFPGSWIPLSPSHSSSLTCKLSLFSSGHLGVFASYITTNDLQFTKTTIQNWRLQLYKHDDPKNCIWSFTCTMQASFTRSCCLIQKWSESVGSNYAIWIPLCSDTNMRVHVPHLGRSF